MIVRAERHEATPNHAHAVQALAPPPERGDDLSARTEPQRHYEKPALAQLVTPGEWYVADARGRDDAVVRCGILPAGVSVTDDDVDTSSASGAKMRASVVGDARLVIDAGHAPIRTDELIQKRGVVTGPRTDLKYALVALELQRLEHRRRDRYLAR